MVAQATMVRIGHSPDPDDAFMFYGLAHGKVPTDGVEVVHVIEDIETLNQRAQRGDLEVTAVSAHAYAYVAARYAVLPYGASVGDGYGPILIAQEHYAPEELAAKRVAIPGRLTTAALVVQLFRPGLQLEVLPFDQILPAVAEGRVDAGVLIHEGQLTYGEFGLHKLVDLGEWWAARTGLPLPLGINVIRKDLDPALAGRVVHAFRASILYGLAHPDEALTYALQFGRGLDRDRGRQFVGMYVNEETRELSPRGREGLQRVLDEAARARLIPHPVPVTFVAG